MAADYTRSDAVRRDGIGMNPHKHRLVTLLQCTIGFPARNAITSVPKVAYHDMLWRDFK